MFARLLTVKPEPLSAEHSNVILDIILIAELCGIAFPSTIH